MTNAQHRSYNDMSKDLESKDRMLWACIAGESLRIQDTARVLCIMQDAQCMHNVFGQDGCRVIQPGINGNNMTHIWMQECRDTIDNFAPDLIIIHVIYDDRTRIDHRRPGFINEIIQNQIRNGRHFVLFDERATKRWESLDPKIYGESNPKDGETPELTICRGDLGFLSNSKAITRNTLEWSLLGPKSIDQLTEHKLAETLREGVDIQDDTKEMYNAFYTAMVGEENQERGTIDAILTPEDEGKRTTLTPTEASEQEQAMLDELVLHGFPKDEQERRSKWAKLPRKARAAIRRLHNMLGHKPKTVMLQILRGARAAPEYIEAVKLMKCDACTETEDPKRLRDNLSHGRTHKDRRRNTLITQMLGQICQTLGLLGRTTENRHGRPRFTQPRRICRELIRCRSLYKTGRARIARTNRTRRTPRRHV